VTFTYQKDYVGSDGEDCAYVKLLVEATETTQMQLVDATEELLSSLQPTDEDIFCVYCGEILIEKAVLSEE